jgi:hypothetical protein
MTLTTKTDYEHAARADMKTKMVDAAFYRPAIYDTPFGLLQVTVRVTPVEARVELDLKWLEHELRRLSGTCPFCGSEHIGLGYTGQPATSFHAYCCKCGARGPTDQGMRSGSGVCDTTSCAQSAFDLFARRASDAASQTEATP